MKAILQEHYGTYEVLTMEETEKPQIQEGEVLVEVQAVSLNAPDWRLLSGKPLLMRLVSGIFRPKHRIRGTDLSGTVVEASPDCRNLKVGDEVYGDLSGAGFGAFAEYVAVKEMLLSLKPKNLSYLEAAALPMTSVTALQGLRQEGKLQQGEKVLILGASGGVGTLSLQLARALGAEVTAVTSISHIAQSMSLGAHHVLDYQETDFDRLEESYDLVLAVNGYYPFSTLGHLLSETGRVVLIGSSSVYQLMAASVLGGLLLGRKRESLKALLAKPRKEDLDYITSQVEHKNIKPVLYKEIPFQDIPEGLKELHKGHAGGKIVAWVKPQRL
ncbi:NAD(P)-dependent alcohol dehydrogenase [Proteiniclasticum sp. SCR006]|uniref:NAD(P)-dependent alcohol dehydrogenase n=1 Tax=Proteiniclasticum aestuarii TaxID=2817862 RepID=A0A939H8K5_9CLOT|nr:NAD(P)-dependent alcohol dehydrogenase [Proteiniclasticum aestuarii]MBO1265116.1 NAD(P)-dependent alcohol dehydrogenase [Proteiniclasticum aestuarii]